MKLPSVALDVRQHLKNTFNDVLVPSNVLVRLCLTLRYVFNVFSADCPCPSYDCDAIGNSETSVLILYSNRDFSEDQYVLNHDGSKLKIFLIYMLH